MQIIVRTCGERTTKRCIEAASRQGDVVVIEARPFGESLRQTYATAESWEQEWTPVIDADVILSPGVLQKAVALLESIKPNRFFCLDGMTNDKILMKTRRAGVHIYKTALLQHASIYIDDNQLKPETHVRACMKNDGFPTWGRCPIVFGDHDFEQYYSDLWRKSICQTQKLPKQSADCVQKWRQMARHDDDYKVILAAHMAGKALKMPVRIDKNMDFDAEINIKRLGLTEKEALN